MWSASAMARWKGAQRLSASKELSLVTVSHPIPGWSAQRLSASKELSQKLRRLQNAGSLSCSTPFGIKGTLTRTVVNVADLHKVLNAFRHQRNSHPMGVLRRAICIFSAQRLSASKELSPDELKTNDLWFFVCSTPFGIKGTLTELDQTRRATKRWCSTPFGIKGTLTQLFAFLRCDARGAQRLSASKELSRVAAIHHFAPARPCSTPFGIKGTLTSQHLLFAFLRKSCSTPFGIKGTLTRWATCRD